MISVVGALAEGTGNKAEAVAPGSSGWSGVLSTGTLNTKHLHSFFWLSRCRLCSRSLRKSPSSAEEVTALVTGARELGNETPHARPPVHTRHPPTRQYLRRPGHQDCAGVYHSDWARSGCCPSEVVVLGAGNSPSSLPSAPCSTARRCL
jgi:hypothetical protein